MSATPPRRLKGEDDHEVVNELKVAPVRMKPLPVNTIADKVAGNLPMIIDPERVRT